jgi:ADP-heptose:LPS heptosyltransferase/predicted SAM-dependent methyltransferase
MTWRADDPQGNESGKVRFDIVRYTRGRGLDLGCGPSKAFPHFLGVDNLKDVNLFGVQMRPDFVVETCERLPFRDDEYDFVYSSHLLEHIVDTEATLKEWWRVIKSGGHLVLYLPHKDFYPNIGQPGGNPDHVHDFLPADIKRVMREVGFWELLVNENRNEGQEYSFLQVYRKITEKRQSQPWKDPKPKKTACVCRFGGWGDMMMTANIFPALKRLGYTITVMTTPKGKDVIEHDPHVDDWIVQDPDQVPNHELQDYWAAAAKRFDKFVNLSESVEGTLLAMPGRANHAWPDSVRRAHLGGVNYLEFVSELAELPYTSEARFYRSDKERLWLNDHHRKHFGDSNPFVILWVLAGSSMHKVYMHMDAVIARVMLEYPEAHVVLVGDAYCKLLEQGWENEPRVHRESGNLTIRQTLALAQRVPLVVGPETGVLNSVAFEANAKIVMLSHSSKRNLSEHWVNTVTLEPDATDIKCYPCHRLHYGDKFCHVNPETHTAICADNIAPLHVWAAIDAAHKEWKALQDVFKEQAA